MKIGVDIDGVIADLESIMTKELNKRYGLNITRDKLTSMKYEECDGIGLDSKQALDMIKDFIKDGKLLEVDRIAGARETMSEWISDGHYVKIVTARGEDIREQTLKWLEKNSVPYNEIAFTNFGPKTNALDGFDYHIDDCLEFAEEVAEKGIKVLLMDYPWNRSKAYSRNIFRVRDWEEIRKIVR